MTYLALSPEAYLDTNVFAAEQDLVRRSWLCVGRETDLAGPGAYCALTLMDQPVVLWRDQRGEIHAFENVCRHRMSTIAEGCGTSKYLTCPFHGWTYADDGELRAAPQASEDVEGLGLRLPEYAVEVWLGFVFVNMDPHARPRLAPRLRAVADLVAPYELAKFEFSARGDASECQANWKLMMEIGLESYHFPYVHQQTLAGNLNGAPNPPAGDGAWTVSVEPRSRPLEQQSCHPVGLKDVHRATTYTFGIFPCTVFNVDVDNVVWFTVLPKTNGRTASVFGTAAGSADAVRILGADAPCSEREYYEWGGRVGTEDNAACERVQQGLHAAGAKPGPIVRSKENCLYEFQQYLKTNIPDYPICEVTP